MNRLTTSCFLCLLAATCHGQAAVVQLPTFHSFGYSGTVLVPDSGGAYLGGVARAAQSGQSSGFGPLRSRATGITMTRANATAHARIIDLAEMDRQLLGGTPQQFLKTQREREQRLAAMSRQPEPPKKKDPVEAAKQLVRDARQCIREGNYKVADYYYRRAVKELPPDLSAIALAEYRRVMNKPPLANQTVIAQAAPAAQR